MPEIMLKIGSGSNYRDGDCLHAFTDRRILCCNGQRHLFKRNPQTNNSERADGEGLLPLGDAAQDYYELTHQFKFENLGSGFGRITRLSDGDVINFESNKPFIQHDGKTVQMDLKLYLARRRQTRMNPQKPGMPMFGLPGREVWYGGRKDYSEAKVNAIWDAIESKLQIARADNKRWPVGNLDIRHHLNLNLGTLTESQAQFIEQPGMLPVTGNESPGHVEKRTSRVDYENLPGLDPSIKRKIPDRLLPVDIRDLYFWEADEIILEMDMQSPFVNLEKLKTEIETDPLGRYTGLDNSEIVASLNAKNRTFNVAITSAELLAWAAQSSDGEDPRIIKLQNAAANHASNQIKGLAWAAVKMVERDTTSLDLGLPDRQAMLAGLVAGGALSAADQASIEALASTQGSRAEELFGVGVVVYQSHVDYVRPQQ